MAEKKLKSKMVLPTEKTAPSKIWSRQKFVTLGRPKVGKSHFWSCDPTALFLGTEPGLDHLDVYRVDIRRWEDFEEFGEQAMVSIEQGTWNFTTLNIDTFDKLVGYAYEKVIENAQKKFSKTIDSGKAIHSIGDIPEGAGWCVSLNMITNKLDKLADSFPCAINLICHFKEQIIKKPGRRDVVRETIGLSGQLGRAVLAWADHTMAWQNSIIGNKETRIIVNRPGEALEAGSRGNVVPETIKVDKDMIVIFNEFRELFD